MTRDEIIEVMARAIAPGAFRTGVRPVWKAHLASRQAMACSQVRAALADADAAGWVMVPKEPTEAMIEAFIAEAIAQHVVFEEDSPMLYPAKCYRATLTAARSEP